jgi:alkylated DNA repair dioxygenase AlkB
VSAPPLRNGMLVDMAMPTPDSSAAKIEVDPRGVTERIALDETSWVDVTRGWLASADALFEALLNGVTWQASRLFRYDHWVEERRLGAMWRPGTPLPHPALADAQRTLQHRYRARFGGFTLMQYRDGRDGQAFHRDTDMRWLDDTVIAILSLGARRPWLLRPRTSRYDHSEGKGAVLDIAPGSGDLLVMGGRSQADWEHSVPYRPRDPSGIRISIQWRYTSRQGRPFVGGSYRAPLRYRGDG